jgi:hypothetical protein
VVDVVLQVEVEAMVVEDHVEEDMVGAMNVALRGTS